MAGIERALSVWDVREVHEVLLDASPSEALAAALAAPAAPDRIVRALLRIRGAGSDGTIEELFTRLGLRTLSRGETEVVLGAAGRPWRVRGGMQALDDAPAGSVRIVVGFRAEALESGRSRLTTETRVAAVDDRARRLFRLYWRAIGPFSALIRRRWLAGVRRALAR